MRFHKIGLLVMLLASIGISGCWSSRELNQMALTIGTGIDRSPEGYLLTDQILNTKAIAEKAAGEVPVVLYSATGRELLEIKRRMTTDVPRKIYNAHLRVLIFGEDFARAGIGKVLDFFQRGHEYRNDFYILVAKGSTAREVLQVLTPLETISGMKIADSLQTAEAVWAPVKSVRLLELLNLLASKGQNPVLTGVEISRREPGKEGNMDALKLTDVHTRLMVNQIGVFKKDKLVGWLGEQESIGYSYLSNNVQNSAGDLQYDSKNLIGVEITSSKTKVKPYLLKGKPAIRIAIESNINVTTVYGDLDVTNMANVAKLQRKSEAKVAGFCRKTVRQVQTEFQSDIFGFGEAIHRKYPKQWKKLQKNWDREFARLPVTITAKTRLNQLGQVTKPFLGK